MLHNFDPPCRDDDILSVAESFDSSINDYPGYHGLVSPSKVESVLKERDENCHVLRYNEQKKTYIISVSWEGEVRHFKLITNNENFETRYQIEGNPKQFRSLNQLLDYYKDCRINRDIGGIGSHVVKRSILEPEHKHRHSHQTRRSGSTNDTPQLLRNQTTSKNAEKNALAGNSRTLYDDDQQKPHFAKVVTTHGRTIGQTESQKQPRPAFRTKHQIASRTSEQQEKTTTIVPTHRRVSANTAGHQQPTLSSERCARVANTVAKHSHSVTENKHHDTDSIRERRATHHRPSSRTRCQDDWAPTRGRRTTNQKQPQRTLVTRDQDGMRTNKTAGCRHVSLPASSPKYKQSSPERDVNIIEQPRPPLMTRIPHPTPMYKGSTSKRKTKPTSCPQVATNIHSGAIGLPTFRDQYAALTHEGKQLNQQPLDVTDGKGKEPMHRRNGGQQQGTTASQIYNHQEVADTYDHLSPKYNPGVSQRKKIHPRRSPSPVYENIKHSGASLSPDTYVRGALSPLYSMSPIYEHIPPITPPKSHSAQHAIYNCPEKAPTLPAIFSFPMGNSKKMNIAAEIAGNYFEFGVLLLEDDDGHILSDIENHSGKRVSHITRQVIQLWLRGKGRQPVTWDTFVDVLRDTGLIKLESDIEENKHHLNKRAPTREN